MVAMNIWFFVSICLVFIQLREVFCLSDRGKWNFKFNQTNHYVRVSKSLYKDSQLKIKVSCDGSTETKLKIGWIIRQAPCYEEYLDFEIMDPSYLTYYYNCPSAELLADTVYKTVRYLKSEEEIFECNNHIHLKHVERHFEVSKTKDPMDRQCRNSEIPNELVRKKNKMKEQPVIKSTTPEMLPQPQELSKQKRVVREVAEVQKNISGEATLNELMGDSVDKPKVEVIIENKTTSENGSIEPKQPITMPNYEAVVDQDGLFLLIVYVADADPDSTYKYNATVTIEMKGSQGYLSAVDWPLLPFYGVMCAVYVIYAVVWLVVSALQWRDLLRIQFWIGGVIFLGLVEKAVFYGEYQYVNTSGQSIHGAILFAEILSCVKRTLARLLVIIVSLGFGIVKPRLGSVLHRIVGVGTLYLVLCVVEGCLRVLKPKNDPSNQTLMAEIPLAVLDSAICWWIFSSLVQTTRTLRLRRNIVKLTLYQHFTNTLIFAVLASIVYMSWSLYNHKLTNCITDWKELWVDEAYWHFLFSLLLLVIMILWRPTNNNQRYAFTPLLDAVDEEEDDYTATNDAFGMKSRGVKNQGTASTKTREHRNSQTEDDLKWVEENIPSSFTDTALPSLLDSDEEIMTVRFERNKME